MHDENSSTTRRGYLKSSLAGILPLGLAGRSFEDRTTIPLLKSGDTVVEKTDVSTDWWNHVNHVEAVLDRSRTQLRKINGYYTSYIESGEDTIGGQNKKKIVVEVDTDVAPEVPVAPDAANGPFPEQLDDVRVETAPKQEMVQAACRNVGKFNPLPGGVNINYNGSSFGSTACRVRYNGNRYVLTVGHLSNCKTGGQVKQQTRYIGSIKKAVSGKDWALVQVSSKNVSISNKVRYPSGNKYPVRGHVTQQGIKKFEDSGRVFHKLGRETGKSTGKIQRYGQDSPEKNCMDHSKMIIFGNDVAKGDSGGPTFLKTDNDTVFVAGLVQSALRYYTGVGCSGKNKYDKTGCLPAWYLYRRNVQFS